MSNQIMRNQIINKVKVIYVIDPSTYIVDEPNIIVKQATLFCGACSSVENITHENSKTLPYIDVHYYDYEHIYSGRCLKKACIEKFVKENERYKVTYYKKNN
jgi:hypothetical protein